MAELEFISRFREAERQIATDRMMTCSPELQESLRVCLEQISTGCASIGVDSVLSTDAGTTEIFNHWRGYSIYYGIVANGISPVLFIEAGDMDAMFFITTDEERYWVWTAMRDPQKELQYPVHGPFADLSTAADVLISDIVSFKDKAGEKPGKRKRERRKRRAFMLATFGVVFVTCQIVGYKIGYRAGLDPFLMQVKTHLYEDVPPPAAMLHCQVINQAVGCPFLSP